MDYSKEETLIRGLRNRDDAAFEYLHQSCFNSIFSIVKATSGNKEDAEDLYNDGIAVLIHKIDKRKAHKSKVSSLLYMICMKRNNDILKKQNSRRNYLNASAESSYEEQFDADMDSSLYRSIFRNSFKKLKGICQELIQKVLEELSIKRIAEDLGLPPVTARKRKSLCQKALLGLIKEDPDYISLRKNKEIPGY